MAHETSDSTENTQPQPLAEDNLEALTDENLEAVAGGMTPAEMLLLQQKLAAQSAQMDMQSTLLKKTSVATNQIINNIQ